MQISGKDVPYSLSNFRTLCVPKCMAFSTVQWDLRVPKKNLTTWLTNDINIFVTQKTLLRYYELSSEGSLRKQNPYGAHLSILCFNKVVVYEDVLTLSQNASRSGIFEILIVKWKKWKKRWKKSDPIMVLYCEVKVKVKKWMSDCK